ncbi:hypothetical protein ACFVTE_18465 [Arthrobacter sp. NPDC058097]|uniref:hypothetical protein n=1 Tax=Arthrobacter sp. NPDC058097 TaxID=3346340 RepID=UPI0036D9986B
MESDDDVLRRQVQRQKRSEWIDFTATIDQKTLDEVEPLIRHSESAAVAALNYLEDHELAEVAHAAIHRAAFMRRGLFGCPIVLREDDEFWTNCSISMSHLRLGTSAGLISDFECSICGKLVEDCDHIMNEVYYKSAAHIDGKCSICGATTCEHEAGKAYPAVAYANARNMGLEEVSLVARPRYPQARIVEESVDLGPAGDDPRVRRAAQQHILNCDGCLGPCKGFNDMQNWPDIRASVPETETDHHDDVIEIDDLDVLNAAQKRKGG